MTYHGIREYRLRVGSSWVTAQAVSVSDAAHFLELRGVPAGAPGNDDGGHWAAPQAFPLAGVECYDCQDLLAWGRWELAERADLARY